MTSDPNNSVELVIDKFIFRFPVVLRYSEAGLWVGQEGGLLRIGMADFAQQRNGDITFVTLMSPGPVEVDAEIASIETVKVSISLPSPVKGKVVEINSALQDSPELINQEPYARGWMVVMQPESLERELSRLLTAETYSKLARQQAEAELKS